ncbi:hypothetical protein [Pedobacter zeae]|uniref:Uncharacterized protein n=1 Tax=Pedobacter zeae TaxID=1737356 RepID=A0A7W6KAS0_9SPHI|nr:hypothetical protein [Pedobacter zeae]MBB4108345.1 hypothetical protein [Pedobacter zeae]GGG93404.1 hypothetical protein GCM10007422_03280 [Pedobacter zeae]
MKRHVKIAQNTLIAYALKSINPELFDLCMSVPIPLLINYKHIEFVAYEFERDFGPINMINKPIFVACLMRLYNPTHLYGMFNKAPTGLRDAIGLVLGYSNPENINYFVSMGPAHYKNPRTAKSINDFADKVYHILKECDELSPEEMEAGSAQTILNIKNYMPSSDLRPVNKYLSE